MKFNDFQQNVQLKGFNQDDFEKVSNNRFAYDGPSVNEDGSKVLVIVNPDQVRETRYGYGLILDSEHTVFIKSWQVLGSCYERMNGKLIVLGRNYFNVKDFQFAGQADEYSEPENSDCETFDDFVKIAKMQAGRIIYKP